MFNTLNLEPDSNRNEILVTHNIEFDIISISIISHLIIFIPFLYNRNIDN